MGSHDRLLLEIPEAGSRLEVEGWIRVLSGRLGKGEG
jgi:hypothetical protein